MHCARLLALPQGLQVRNQKQEHFSSLSLGRARASHCYLTKGRGTETEVGHECHRKKEFWVRLSKPITWDKDVQQVKDQKESSGL